jgi:hypothetical protein
MIEDHNLPLPDQKFENTVVNELVLRARLDEIQNCIDIPPSALYLQQRKSHLIQRIKEES